MFSRLACTHMKSIYHGESLVCSVYEGNFLCIVPADHPTLSAAPNFLANNNSPKHVVV